MHFFQSVRFENGTDGYDNLENPGSPTYTYFYFFNLTNAEEYEMNGSTPIVDEIGPYVYRLVQSLEIVLPQFNFCTSYRSIFSCVYSYYNSTKPRIWRYRTLIYTVNLALPDQISDFLVPLPDMALLD